MMTNMERREEKRPFGNLEKGISDSYAYYSMLDGCVAVDKAGNRNDGEEVKDEEG